MKIDQTINGFKSHIDSQGGLVPLNRFSVVVPIPNTLEGVDWISNTNRGFGFTARSASIPSKTISTNPVMAAGPEQKYPYQDVYEDLTISFLSTKGTEQHAIPERSFFEAWMATVISHDNMLVGFSDDYSVVLRVGVLTNNRNEQTKLAEYMFIRAYPIGLGAIDFSHDSEELMSFDVTFSYDKWRQVKQTSPSLTDLKPNPDTKLIEERAKPISNSKRKAKLHIHPKAEWADRKLKPANNKKDSWKDSPIKNKRVVGKFDFTPKPKKISKQIIGKVQNRIQAELGIRPIRD